MVFNKESVTEVDKRAVIVNRDNHIFNLAGVHAAKLDALVVTFFGTVESIYAFCLIPHFAQRIYRKLYRSQLNENLKSDRVRMQLKQSLRVSIN